MDTHGVGGGHRAPAGDPQSQCQVEVLHVGEDRLVQAADLFPCGAPVGRRRAGRTRERRTRVAGARERSALLSRKPRQGDVGRQADAVDPLAAGLEHERGHRSNGLVLQRARQPLEEVRTAVDVVVRAAPRSRRCPRSHRNCRPARSPGCGRGSQPTPPASRRAGARAFRRWSRRRPRSPCGARSARATASGNAS